MSTTTVPCPTCQAPTEFTEANACRPFCSKRCQLIDLGEWFSEEHRIPGDANSENPSEQM